MTLRVEMLAKTPGMSALEPTVYADVVIEVTITTPLGYPAQTLGAQQRLLNEVATAARERVLRVAPTMEVEAA